MREEFMEYLLAYSDEWREVPTVFYSDASFTTSLLQKMKNAVANGQIVPNEQDEPSLIENNENHLTTTDGVLTENGNDMLLNTYNDYFLSACLPEAYPSDNSHNDETSHLDNDHILHLDSNRKVQSGKKPHKCFVCGKGFAQNGTLQTHMKIHSGLKPHQCHVCGKCFTRRGDLKRHLIIHSGEKPYKCTICGNGFTQSGSLKMHLRRHKDEKECKICGLNCKDEIQLQKHMSSFHTEKSWHCQAYDEHFEDFNGLQNHIMLVHDMVRIASKCDVCGLIFMDDDHLQKHMLVHKSDQSLKSHVNDFQLEKREQVHLPENQLTRKQLFDCNSSYIQNHKQFDLNNLTSSFSQRVDLERNFIDHNIGNLKDCEVCGENIKHGCNLQKHLQSSNKRSSERNSRINSKRNSKSSFKNTHDNIGEKPYVEIINTNGAVRNAAEVRSKSEIKLQHGIFGDGFLLSKNPKRNSSTDIKDNKDVKGHISNIKDPKRRSLIDSVHTKKLKQAKATTTKATATTTKGCEVCGENLLHGCNLELHLKIHSGESPYTKESRSLSVENEISKAHTITQSNANRYMLSRPYTMKVPRESFAENKVLNTQTQTMQENSHSREDTVKSHVENGTPKKLNETPESSKSTYSQSSKEHHHLKTQPKTQRSKNPFTHITPYTKVLPRESPAEHFISKTQLTIQNDKNQYIKQVPKVSSKENGTLDMQPMIVNSENVSMPEISSDPPRKNPRESPAENDSMKIPSINNGNGNIYTNESEFSSENDILMTQSNTQSSKNQYLDGIKGKSAIKLPDRKEIGTMNITSTHSDKKHYMQDVTKTYSIEEDTKKIVSMANISKNEQIQDNLYKNVLPRESCTENNALDTKSMTDNKDTLPKQESLLINEVVIESSTEGNITMTDDNSTNLSVQESRYLIEKPKGEINSKEIETRPMLLSSKDKQIPWNLEKSPKEGDNMNQLSDSVYLQESQNINKEVPKESLMENDVLIMEPMPQLSENLYQEKDWSKSMLDIQTEVIINSDENLYASKLNVDSIPETVSLHTDLILENENNSNKCLICNQYFLSNEDLQVHARIHNTENPFHCEICKKSFTQYSGLQTHLMIHSGERPFKCDVCGNGFTRSSSLMTHMKIHSGIKPHNCKDCGKCFARNGDLKRHMVMHSGEKPYICTICDKRFTQSSTLKTHSRSHSGEKPYQCHICDRGFVSKSKLNTHSKYHKEKTS